VPYQTPEERKGERNLFLQSLERDRELQGFFKLV